MSATARSPSVEATPASGRPPRSRLVSPDLFNHEVLHSERRRVLTLAGALATILASLLLIRAVTPGFVSSLFHGHASWRAPLVLFTPFIVWRLA